MKLFERFRNLAMSVGLMLSSVNFIVFGNEINNPNMVNVGALTFLLFSLFLFQN